MVLIDLPAASIACQVVETHVGELAKIQLRIEAPAGASGRFSIRVSRQDRAGTADLSQTGTFRAPADGGDDVGDVSLSASPDSTIDVEAHLDIEGQTIKCLPRRDDRL